MLFPTTRDYIDGFLNAETDTVFGRSVVTAVEIYPVLRTDFQCTHS